MIAPIASRQITTPGHRMSAPTAPQITVPPANPVASPLEPVKANPPYRLSVAGLAFALLAFGLAIIPPIAAGRPLLAPFAEPAAPEPPAAHEGGLTLKYKQLSVNIGGKVPKAKPVVDHPKLTSDPIRWFTIAAIGCALAGLAVATAAQLRERHTIITTMCIALCVSAITWQYLMAGLLLGVAIAVLILILRSLGDAF